MYTKPLPPTKQRNQSRFPPLPQCIVRLAIAFALGLGLSACSQNPNRPPDLVQLIRNSSPAVVGIGNQTGVQGSGFRLDGTRWIVTAAHVVRALRNDPPVIMWNSNALKARLIRVDDDNDLALLEIETDTRIPGLRLANATSESAIGQWVVIIGCPFGAQPTASTGIVSAMPGAVLKPEALQSRLQLNAAINPGNSGGPVLDLDGRVIGVANATVPGGFGIGFAVPVSSLRTLIAGESAKP